MESRPSPSSDHLSLAEIVVALIALALVLTAVGIFLGPFVAQSL